jgi:16S rRNA C967 or C1407 C5-methylase (RsmB/RsmF family)/NOL1/NOP2/fmu family ribosome biogenesis protein
LTIPAALLDSLQNIKGFDKAAFLEVHYSGEQNTSIRINPNKISDVGNLFLSDMDLETLTISPVPWSSNGYYLSARPSFTLDPFFHGGAYYVQEASSMFLEEVMKQSIDLSKSLKVLDLCAAPGGKSTLIQSLISAKSLLVSNEVIKTRVTILSENIAKWGASNVVVTNNDPKDFQRLPGYFDIIVVDAPCSGSGLFRKDPKAITEWSEQNVELCSQRQQRILADILPALKEEGILIYSTCSYSKQENEEIGDWLIKEQQLSTIHLALKNEWNIIPTPLSESGALGYRFYPDKLKGEGFFIAAFKKEQMGNDCPPDGKSKGKWERLTGKEIEILKPWLKNADDFFFIRQKEEVIALPVHIEGALGDIQKALYIKRAGIKLGVIIRNEFIPAHELALSSIRSNSVAMIGVDKETALQYLRRQEIKPETEMKGWVIVTYKKLPLGWIKVLPNRVNNYYPKEWRILNK